jgi:acyl-CoA synthetase (AMP-forming)/AMP-acid ligase II
MTKPQSVFDAFSRAASRWPDRPFLNVLPETAGIYRVPAGEIAFATAQQEVVHLARLLSDAGYQKGHRVMLLLENRPAFFLWWLTLNKLGISVVPINPDLRMSEISYVIGHAEPVLGIAIPTRMDDLHRAVAEAGIAMKVITPDDPLPPARPNATLAYRDGPDTNAEAALLYTSGTTGLPKGCIMTNDYFLEAGNWYSTTGGLCALNTNGERMITPLPIFHMNAMAYSFMAMLFVGGCLTILDRFHPRSWWASVRNSRATCLHYLGVMPSMLMGADPGANDQEHSVRFGFGAGVDPKLHAGFESRFGFPLIEAWAMTETGAGAVICANRPPRRVGESCLGVPEGALEVRIADETGHETAQGPGELLVRRAGGTPRRGFFAGYFKNQPATDEAWKDGWFHTGDIVRREKDGTMFFVDRKKNVIRRSGENIAAVEVESVLLKHPAVTSVGVTSVPDTLRGDEVFACLVVNKPANSDLATEIVTWALDQIAYYKVPGYVAFVDELPVTSTQKIQRADLKSWAAELRDDASTTDTRHLKKRSAA